MLNYEGLFFEGEEAKKIISLESSHLGDVDGLIHATFRHNPDSNEIFNEIVGKTYEIYLIGYANDGKNSGYTIEIPDCLKPYYINYEDENKNKLRIPHITASLAKGARALETKNLEFKPLPQKIAVTGKFGYWINEKDREFLSYEPYDIK